MEVIKLIETAKDNNSRLSEIDFKDRIDEKKGLSCSISIDENKSFQTFKGFGGAITEASGYVLSKLSPEKQEEVLNAYFNEKLGNNLTFARTHMNSSDFSLENWACVEEKDETLESFSMERTDKYITPNLQKANIIKNKNLKVMISTWSPPKWMKSNNDMNHGGKLLPQYKELLAKYWVKFLDNIKARDLNVELISIQNEPAAVQTWDSCIWTAEEEGEFAAKYLGPALEKAGSDNIKILVWDHNREILWDRFSTSMKAENADKYIGGAAYHWYSGDQYDQVAKVAENYPDKELVFTEGCVEGGPRNGAWFTGERYAHNIFNDLNNGCTAWIDWNILLDMEGGPNHVGNFCDAPILADASENKLYYQSSYYYIGHFSRFIQPGAIRLFTEIEGYMTPCTIDGRVGNTIECTAFKNPDATISFIVYNRTEEDAVYDLKLSNGKSLGKIKCPARGIQTAILK